MLFLLMFLLPTLKGILVLKWTFWVTSTGTLILAVLSAQTTPRLGKSSFSKIDNTLPKCVQ